MNEINTMEIILDIALSTIKMLLPIFMPVIIFLILLFILKIIIIKRKNKKILNSGIEEIDNMSGRAFEIYLEQLFKKLDYEVELTKQTGDFGADLVVKKDDLKYVVQAKRHKNKVGISAVQEIVGAKGYYSADYGIVFTNSFFTEAAIKLAKANDIELWDRDKLIEFLNKIDSINHELISNPEIEKNDKCVICRKKVSEKVYNYCVTNKERFNNQIYCYEQQKKKYRL